MRSLRTLAPAVAVLAALSLSSCGSSDKDAKADKPAATKSAEVKHTIEVNYDDPLDGPGEAYVATLAASESVSAQALAEEILKAGEIDGIAEGFAEAFKLPEDLKVHVSNQEGSPFYDPSTKTVNIFYDFANLTANIIKASQTGSDGKSIDDTELGTQWAAVNDFILIHEFAHAFVDVLEIPVTGREEDAADGLATWFFTDFVAEHGSEYAFAAAQFFAALQDYQGSPDATQFADEHSLSIQRAGDIACKVAGASEENMQIMAQIGFLPDARLQRCPAEYEQLHNAWTALLKPHLRHPADEDKD